MTISTQQPTGLIFALKRYSIHDGPGIRTTVFLKGCPLACWWCHNPEGISPEKALFMWEDRCLGCGECREACPSDAVFRQDDIYITDSNRCTLHAGCVEVCPAEAREIIGEEVAVEGLMARIEDDTLFFDQSGGGVTFSGGEPLMQPVFLESVLKACRSANLHTAVDTSGYGEQAVFKAIMPYTDLFLFDLKLMDGQKHLTCTGVSNELILSNLIYLAGSGKDVILRIPVIPGLTDDAGNIKAIAEFAAELKTIRQVDLLPYHKMSLEKYHRMKIASRFHPEGDVSPEAMKNLESILLDKGFRVTAGG